MFCSSLFTSLCCVQSCFSIPCYYMCAQCSLFLSLFASFEIEIILASRWLCEATLWLFSEVLVITIIYSQFWNVLGRHHLHPDSFRWIFITSWARVPKLCFPKFFFSFIRFVNWIDVFSHYFLLLSLASTLCVYLKTNFSCSLLCGSTVFIFMF